LEVNVPTKQVVNSLYLMQGLCLERCIYQPNKS